MNEEYLELLFSAYGNEVGDDYDAFKTAMSNEDYSRMLFETHSEELGDDYAEFNKAVGINIEPYVEPEEEVSMSGEYGVKEQDVFGSSEPIKPVISKDISYDDFNMKGQNSAFDNAEEDLEDKLSALYPNLTFDTPIMNGGVSSDMLDVTNEDGEVFSWKMNTDYNAGKRDSDGEYTVVDPEDREQESRDNYINFLEFANKSKYKDGKYKNPNDIRTLGPDYMVKNDQGQDIEMQVTPGLTQKAISIMKSNPDVTSLDEAIDIAVDTEFGQMNIAWQGSVQNKKAKENFEFKNKVKSLASDNNFNPNISGSATGLEASSELNNTIEVLEELGMPKEVVASARADAENNIGFLDYLASGGSSNPMSFNAGDPTFTRPASVAARGVVNSNQEIRNNVRAWLDGSQTWGENTNGPLVLKAYNEFVDQKSKEEADNNIKQKVIEDGINQEQVIKRQEQLLNAEGNTLSKEQALVQAEKDVIALTVQDIKTKKAKEDGDRVLKAELPYYEGKSKSKIEALQSELAEINKLEEGQEKAVKYKEYLNKVRDFLDDDEVNLLKQGDKFVRKDRQEQADNLNSIVKSGVKDLLLEAPDKLDEKLLDTDTELLNLAKEIKRKGLSETLNEGSALQLVGALGQELVGAEGSAFEDFRKIEKWVETGEMPDLLTPLPVSTTDSYLTSPYGDASGSDPLVKKYNDLLQYRSTLLLAQSLNADPTSFGKTESGVGRFLEGVVEATPEAVGMNSGLTNDKQRELGFDILEDVYGIKKTDKDKANLYQVEHDLWKSSGKMIPGLMRMGAEIYLTTVATGGMGFGPAVLRSATFRTLLRGGVSRGMADKIAAYGTAVMTEYVGLQGSNAMERSLDFGPGIENPGLFALTASAIRLTGAQASSKFNDAIIDTYRTGSNAQRNALEYFYAFPTTASTEAGALKYTNSLVDRSVKSLSRTTMAAGGKITGAAGGALTISTADNVGAVLAGDKTVAQALNDVTNPDHLMELGGALLFLGMSRPDKYSKQTIERFRTEVDLIRGNNPQWNKLRRSLGMKTVSDKSEEYEQGEEAFSERVDSALELKKEEINNSNKSDAQKNQEISALEFNANRLKLKIPLDVLAKDLANPAVMGSYKELEQAAYAISTGGFNAKNLSVIEAASFTSDGTSGVKMLEFYGLDAAQAQQVVDFSYSMRDVAKRHFQGDLTNANFQKYIDESITESRLESSKEKIKKNYEAKRIDKADYESQTEEIDAQLDINLKSKKRLLEAAKVERAGKELEKIEEYKKAGFEIKEMNDAEMKKFMEDNGGNFSSTGFGYQGVVNGKSIALINTDATARENVGGTEVHEIWHHPFERRLGDEAMAKKIESLMKDENLTEEQASAKVDSEAREYLDGFQNALENRGILDLVDKEVFSRPGILKELVEIDKDGNVSLKDMSNVSIREMKEFVNEFIQLNENGAFNNLKSEGQRKAAEKQNTKDLTEKEYNDALNDPIKFVDFVLSGKYNSKNINDFLKREADALGMETETTGLQASEKIISKGSKDASEVNKKIETKIIDQGSGGVRVRDIKDSKFKKQITDELTKANNTMIEVRARRAANNPRIQALEPSKRVSEKEFQSAFNAEFVEALGQYKPVVDGKRIPFGAYMNQRLTQRFKQALDKAKQGQFEGPEVRLEQPTKEGERGFDTESKDLNPEEAMIAKESGKTETTKETKTINPLEAPNVKPKAKEIEDAIDFTEADAVGMRTGGFKGVGETYGGKAASIAFGVPEAKIMDPKKNLTYAKKIKDGIPEPSEAGNIQQAFTNKSKVETFIKNLPETNVSDMQTNIGLEKLNVSRDVYGYGTGINNRVLKTFYNKTGKRSKGLTSQPAIWELKPEFKGKISNETIAKVQKELGITEAGQLNKYDRNIGQLLKGVAKLEGYQIANTVVRKKIEGMDIKSATPTKQLLADLKAGANRFQASAKKKSIQEKSDERLDKKAPGTKSIQSQIGQKTVVQRVTKAMLGDVADAGGNFFLKQGGFMGSSVWNNSGALFEAALRKGFPFVGNYLNKIESLTKDFIVKEEMTEAKARKKAEEVMSLTKEALDLGLTLETSSLQKAMKEQIKSNPEKYNKYSDKQLKQLDKAINAQDYKKLEKNLTELSDIKAGKDLLIDMFKEIYDKDSKNLDVLSYMMYHANSNSHPMRNFATVLGKELGLKGRGHEEHTLPFGEFSQLMLDAITGKNVDLPGFKKWINENYFQEVTSKGDPNNGIFKTKEILDHPRRSTDKLGNDLESWDSANQLHPELKIQLAEALAGKRKFKDVISADIRKYNEYSSERGYVNPNKMNRLGVTDAKRYNVEVPKKLQNNSNIIEIQNHLIHQQLIGKMSAKEAREMMDLAIKDAPARLKATRADYKMLKQSPVLNLSEKMSTNDLVRKARIIDKALANARKTNKKPKKIRVFDFDDTVGVSKNKVFALREGVKKVLNAEEFAKEGLDLIDEGWEMDFSDFNKVTEGGKGPLFDLMKTMKEAKGERDMFILTARAPEAAPAIHMFLKEMGIDIPIENVVGLGKSTGEAKADWLVGKAAEGYNDFYFADDAPQNVKAVRDALEVLDIKSQVQQARMNASEKLSEDFNKILEEKTGIGAEKVFSDIKAEIRGNKARKQKFFIPPSAEDFLGLLYATLPKGKKGEAALDFYQKNLFDPYTRATDNLSRDRVNLMDDFKALKKELDVPADLRKETKSGFTNEQAVRVYMWGKEGKDVPGLSKSDFKELNDIIEGDAKLKSFADQIFEITKGDGYNTPGKDWAVGTITTDLIEVLNKTKRAKYLEPWKQNADIIFSKENLNKLEAAYGKKYREAMENTLSRMKSGSNRTSGGNRLSNQVLDYINNSTGVTMFLNTRSALLQTISAANFVNWSFNNPLMAGKAFANQPQYWKHFVKLMNSDYLKDRRNGLKLNINESEIADAAKTSKNKAKAALNYILEKGYLPTKYADSFAIASGGAMFYRNRINDLVKKGFTISEAETQAMKEFRQVSEKSQQSSDPSKISSQQSGDLGRIILQYANTPMQYARIQKRAVQDIVNGRGDMKANVSKIIYYGFLQNLIFNALQQGAFALGFGDDFSDKDKDDKLVNTVNGMLDSSLRGLGLGGVSLQVLKNLGLDVYKRSKRDRPEYVDSYYKLLEFSPAIKSKLSRFKSAAYPFDSKKRRAEVFDKGFSLDNPAYESMAKVVTAVTNVPLDRMYLKIDNLKNATADETETWMGVANFLGWPTWQLEPKEYNKANNVSVKSTVPKVKTKKEKIDKLKSMTYIQLRNKAKKEGKEYSGKNKKELIDILKKNM